jgi:hypothetical protein
VREREERARMHAHAVWETDKDKKRSSRSRETFSFIDRIHYVRKLNAIQSLKCMCGN